MKLWSRGARFVGSWYVMAGCVLLLVCSCLILPPRSVFGRVPEVLGIRNAPVTSLLLNLTAAYRGDRWVVYEGMNLEPEDARSARPLLDVNVWCFARQAAFWDVALEDLKVFATRLDRDTDVNAELRRFDHGEELVEAVARYCEQQDSRLGPAIGSLPIPRSVIRWRGLLNNIAASVLAGALAAGLVTRAVRRARGGVGGSGGGVVCAWGAGTTAWGLGRIRCVRSAGGRVDVWAWSESLGEEDRRVPSHRCCGYLGGGVGVCAVCQASAAAVGEPARCCSVGVSRGAVGALDPDVASAG